MGRMLIGGLAAYLAWSAVAVIVSGISAGGPYLAAGLVSMFAYGATRLLMPEIGRVRHERTRRSEPSGHHMHGTHRFTTGP